MLSNPAKIRLGKLAWFVIINMLADLLLVVFVGITGPVERGLFGVLFVGTIFYQMSMLGIWAGLGSNSWGIRLFGVLCGVGYFGLLLGFVTGEGPAIFYLVFFAIGIIVVILLIVRLRGYRLSLSSETPKNSMQYSIRDLLVLTFVVAALLSLGKIFKVTLGPISYLHIMLSFAIGVSVLGSISVWLISGWQHWMLLRIFLLIVVGACVGVCLGFYNDRLHWLWTMIMVVDAGLLGVSLGILRSWGYKLSRQRSEQTP